MNYNQFSKKQAQTLTWWNDPELKQHDAIICDGSVRSGKTISMAVGFILWSMCCFNKQKFAICGKTIQSLRRNVVSFLPTWLEGLFTIREKFSDNCIIVSVGKRSNTYYLFGGKDEGSAVLIQGLTLAGVLFDEVALMPRSFVEQAIARCSVSGSRFWFNCNPDSPNHWFYTEWIVDEAEKKNRLYLHFTMDDNLSLSPDVKQRYENLYSGVFYDRFIRGLWVVAEGLVYQMVSNNPERYRFADQTSGINGQFYVSIDYGTVNPCSMGLWCVQNNRAIRIAESYFDSRKEHRQKTDEEHYAALEELTRGRYIQHVIVDPSAASFLECVRRHGKYMVLPATNDVLNGIRVTAQLLQSGKVLVSPDCRDAWREFGLYRWDDKSNQDAVIKENDHAMDDIRYFCATVLSREFRWADWGNR